MIVIVTTNVENKVRGFLASISLEVSSGVYVSNKINTAVKDRVISILEKWKVGLNNDNVIVIWSNNNAPGGCEIKIIGNPNIDFIESAFLVLSKKELSQEHFEILKNHNV